jgi:cytochrome c oxidase subunit 2
MHLDWTVFTYAGLAVFAIVGGLIVFPLLVWRRRGDALPPQFRRNVPIEIVTTVIPLIMVVLLFILSYRVESAVEHLAPVPSVVVNVVGFRWSWQFSYPGTDVLVAGTPQRGPEMVIPLNETTRINLTSVDVNHRFWVPAFLFKRDAIAGMNNAFDWHPERLGSFPGRCAEFCGLEHAFMTFTVRVVSPADFKRWLLEQRSRSTAYRKTPQ